MDVVAVMTAADDEESGLRRQVARMFGGVLIWV